MVLESFLGNTLVRNDGTEVKTSDLSTDRGAVIGFYFSARWCPPCGVFTPKLATIYKELKDAHKDFEIVFLSWDNDERSFKEYQKEQPWLALPYADRDGQDALQEKYVVRGIPFLVLLEADTGNTILPDGRDVIEKYGAAGFPFTKNRLAEAKKEIQQKKEAALKELSDLKFLGELGTVDEPGKKLDVCEVTRSSEAVAFAFMNGSSCQGSDIVLPKLLHIQQNMGKEKLSVIVVPMMSEEEENFSEEVLSNMKGVPMISRGSRAQEVADKFEPVLGEIDVPQVVIVDAREETSMRLLAENASRPIYFHGEAAFPWTDEAIIALEEREEALRREIKEKQENLEFLTPSDTCHIVDKHGAQVSLERFQSMDVVGIYFGGHWCGPCRAFSPKLIETYNECKEQGKTFEVVFISSDENQKVFDEYYEEMPWCTLKYEDRLMKEVLSDVFEVGGIPTLILLKGDGEKITDDGHAVVSMGADYFPWGPEEMERGRAEKEERKARKLAKAKEDEELAYVAQAEAGKIPLRRHKGEISDIKIGTDHVVKFNSFATVSAPSAVIPRGSKGWYEVTFIKGSGVSQVGWATTEFEECDRYSSNGVGDDNKSWGFDGQRTCKWFDGSFEWGQEFEPSGDRVLGVAVDMETGKILYGLDGDWSEPMGVAFEDLDLDQDLYPAITGLEMKISVNFGDREMKFGPPDDSFEKVVDIVGR